jgi:hypothetical protein
MATKKRGKHLREGCHITKEELQRRLRARDEEVAQLKLRIKILEAEVQSLRQLAQNVSSTGPPYEGNGKKDHDVSEFFNSIPMNEEDWLNKRTDLNLCTPRDVINAFFLLTCGILLRATSETNLKQTWNISQTLRGYKRLVDFLDQRRASATHIFNFSQLLFVCLCCVARKDGASVEEVDELMNEVLPKRKGKDELGGSYLAHIRTAVQWPIAQEGRLKENLGNRANELFLLCMSHFSAAYRQFLTQSSKPNTNYVSQTLKQISY